MSKWERQQFIIEYRRVDFAVQNDEKWMLTLGIRYF